MNTTSGDLSPNPSADPPEDNGRHVIRSPFISEAYAEVKEIGKGKRWYDAPYRALHAVQGSRAGKKLPSRVRGWLNYGVNYLLPSHSHDLNRVWSRQDPLHNLAVPDDEHVEMPGIWVIELFPPSQFGELAEAIKRQSWDQRRIQFGTGEANREMLERSRAGGGWSWWNLAQITSPKAGYRFPDGVSQELPDEFEAIELIAMQVGPGLTAVVAYFHLSSTGSVAVDESWHADHEPELVRGQGRPRALDRLWNSFRMTQRVRGGLHQAARSWLSGVCPGSFAASAEPQPLFDLLLLSRYDPALGDRTARGLADALRALVFQSTKWNSEHLIKYLGYFSIQSTNGCALTSRASEHGVFGETLIASRTMPVGWEPAARPNRTRLGVR